jgi:hypothetical protein
MRDPRGLVDHDVAATTDAIVEVDHATVVLGVGEVVASGLLARTPWWRPVRARAAEMVAALAGVDFSHQMVVQVATAQLVTGSFRATFGLAVGLGAVAGVSGVVLSYYADVPSGPSIVVLAIGGFVVVAVGAAAMRSLRRRTITRGTLRTQEAA